MASSKLKKRQKATRFERFEIAIAKALAPASRSPAVKAAGTASDIGDQPPLYALAGGVLVGGLIGRQPRAIRAGLRMLAAHSLAIAIKSVIKHKVDRTRPTLATRGQYESGAGEHDQSSYNSFPSGHSASSLAVARAYSREYPDYDGVPLAIAGGIAALQVVRGKHYVSDTIAGIAIGVIAEGAVNAVADRLLPGD